MADDKVIASIELSQALGLPVGVPVTPAKLEQEVKRHTKTATPGLTTSMVKALRYIADPANWAFRSGWVVKKHGKLRVGDMNKLGRLDLVECREKSNTYLSNRRWRNGDYKQVTNHWLECRLTDAGRAALAQWQASGRS